MKLPPPHPLKLKLPRLKRLPPLKNRRQNQRQIIQREISLGIQIFPHVDLVVVFDAFVFPARHQGSRVVSGPGGEL